LIIVILEINITYMKGATVTILVIVVLAAAGYLWIRDRDVALIPNNDDEMVACTMDAMMCPDGTYVGRVPPTCEFAACPSTSTSTPTTTSTTSATIDLTI
jgi:hypothetical protein